MIESGPGDTPYDDEMVNLVKVLMPNADGKRHLVSQVHDLIWSLIGDEVSKMKTMKSVDIHKMCNIKYVQYLDKDDAQL